MENAMATVPAQARTLIRSPIATRRTELSPTLPARRPVAVEARTTSAAARVPGWFCSPRPAPRVLILSASAGVGHLRAAEAIEVALRRLRPDARVVNTDALSLTSPAFRHVYGRTYFDLVAAAPHLIGYLYDRLDRPAVTGRLDRAKAGYLRLLHLRRVAALIESEPWDVVVNTHFLSAGVVASLRDAGRVGIPQVTVTTDFYVHAMWVRRPVERYFVASEEAATCLAPLVPDSQIEVTGIPIHPNFAAAADAAATADRSGMGPTRAADVRPTVLQLAGGLGIGPIEAVHRQLLEANEPMNLVVVAGRNAGARDRLKRIEVPARHRRTVLGFTDRMPELMASADLLVSKPGGLTTSEALATGTPMLVVEPIPGQETRNGDYLLEHGAAAKVNKLTALTAKVEALLGDPGRLGNMAAAARRIGRPSAAFDVARQALAIAGEGMRIEHPKRVMAAV